jgi:ABC-type polysaccharide/polyol phosphate transport system ATPase subunit
MASVVVENVRVDFPIYAAQRSLRTALFERATGGLIQREGKRRERVVVKALSGVSLSLRDGDRLGLIGHNGSGKSTLLKVLAGIYEPTEGQVLVEGRVTPLFDLMPGLDVEDSGYENIITCGLLLGLSRDEIENRIPDVEEFSELGQYLELPVRTYSTGMMMRLGFALVTAIDPGVLLMDEGIGAGDARFAERAERRLNEFVARSRIVVLASHVPAMIKSICNKAALLQAGRLVAKGSVEEVFDEYDAILHGPRAPRRAVSAPPIEAGEERADVAAGADAPVSSADAGADAKFQNGTGPVWPLPEFKPDKLGSEFAECLRGAVETLGGVACGEPEINGPFRISLCYRLLKNNLDAVIPSIHIFDSDKRHVLISTPPLLPGPNPGTYSASCRIEPFMLNYGRYSVGLGLSSVHHGQGVVHFYTDSAMRFEIIEPDGADPRRHGYLGEFPGVSRLRLEWLFTRLDETQADIDNDLDGDAKPQRRPLPGEVDRDFSRSDPSEPSRS